MKKLMSIMLFMVVFKCYGGSISETNSQLSGLSNLADEGFFESMLSLLIAFGIVYGAKIGRESEVQ